MARRVSVTELTNFHDEQKPLNTTETAYQESNIVNLNNMATLSFETGIKLKSGYVIPQLGYGVSSLGDIHRQ